MKELKKIVKLIFNISCVLAIFLWAFSACNELSSLPEVHRSYETKSCLKVISDNPKHTCNNMPRKYRMIWVL